MSTGPSDVGLCEEAIFSKFFCKTRLRHPWHAREKHPVFRRF